MKKKSWRTLKRRWKTLEDTVELLEKYFLKSAAQKKDQLTQADVWSEFLKRIEISCPDLYQVIELFLIIPNGTAEVERYFKLLKAMKSKKRNRLSASKAMKMFMIAHFLDLDDIDMNRLYELFEEELKSLE